MTVPAGCNEPTLCPTCPAQSCAAISLRSNDFAGRPIRSRRLCACPGVNALATGTWGATMGSMRRLVIGGLVCMAVAASAPLAVADPATDEQGFVDSTARCTSPAVAVAFGRTASSRVAVCKDPSGQYEYRGVRVSDGAKFIGPAKAADGGYVADNDGITYTVTSSALVVRSGSQVIREEPMIDYRGQKTGAPAPSMQPSAAPDTPTPTTPLPPPLPAEVGGG